jgi:hypothetical protein
MNGKKYDVHVLIDEETYKKLWKITAKKFTKPERKLSTILREAINEYLEKHYKE